MLHNPMASTLRIPGRDDLKRPDVRILLAGGKTKADLLLVDLGQGPLVVKDFRHKAAWVRCWGRLQISRECGAYRWLGEMPGVPRFAGRVDPHALAIEWIDGEQLGQSTWRKKGGAALHAQLRGLVERLHDSGLAHLDLRGFENILVDAEGRLYILDLASAVWFRPGGWARRRLLPWFRKPDRAALLKWKQRLDAGPYTAEEQSFLRRYRFWRSLWIFNRK